MAAGVKVCVSSLAQEARSAALAAAQIRCFFMVVKCLKWLMNMGFQVSGISRSAAKPHEKSVLADIFLQELPQPSHERSVFPSLQNAVVEVERTEHGSTDVAKLKRQRPQLVFRNLRIIRG